jgi:hypothetical protein
MRSFAGAQDDMTLWCSQTFPVLIVKNHYRLLERADGGTIR